MDDETRHSEEDAPSNRQSDVYLWIKNKIANEGVQARNIIKYNVPVDLGDSPKRIPSGTSRPDVLQLSPTVRDSCRTSGGVYEQTEWSRTTSPQSVLTPRSSVCSNSFGRCASTMSANTISSTPSSCSLAKPRRQFSTMSNLSVSLVSGTARQTENEYRARYWGQMLDTLRRTIDEIYSACETDDSEVECKEVIMILEHSKQDFHSLIEKMNLLRDYERADKHNKPFALAWDERTTLPGKPIMQQVLASTVRTTANHPGGSFISVSANPVEADGNDSDTSYSWQSIVKLTSPGGVNHCAFGPQSGSVIPTNPSVPVSDLNSHSIDRFSSAASGLDLPSSGLSSHKDEFLDDTVDEELIDAPLDSELGPDVLFPEDEADDDDAELLAVHGSNCTTPDTQQNTGSAHLIPPSFLSKASSNDLDEVDEDADDNTISRDLRQLDKAIASVTTAERVLTNRLGRAQCAEAALRRQLLAEDEATNRVCSIPWRMHRKPSIKVSKISRIADRNGNMMKVQSRTVQPNGLLLSTDPVGDRFSSREKTTDFIESGESDATREIEDAFSPTTRTCTEPSTTCHSGSTSLLRARRCCGCTCHESTDSSYVHQLKSPTPVVHSGSRFISTSLPQNMRHVRASSDVHVNLPLRVSQHTGVISCSPSETSKPTAGFETSVTAQSVSSRMDTSASAPSAVQFSSNGAAATPVPSVFSTTSISPYKQAMFSPNIKTAAVGTAKGLLFLSEMNAKSRIPGHGIQMHEKLSARSRRKTTNSIHELEQKQARARVLRQQHLMERSERVHELSKKVEEVHMQKRILLHQRRSCLERRLHAAERKRKEELERRVLKAHDEETKGREIAFIQSLEAEQKQHSILTKHEESRARLHELAAERRRRLEEKLCREEAAKGRRRAIEASRRARLAALQARWETRAQQLASRAEHLEHTRRAAAKAKEQHREVKIASLEEQQRAHIEQLRARIQRKQEESERRHLESLREISRKAFEMSVLTHTMDESFTAAGMDPYPTQKWCRACQVMIVSEVSLKSHLHGKRHQRAVLEACENRLPNRSDLGAFNLSHLVDAPADMLDPKNKMDQDRIKTRRKRAKKLRQRMNQRAAQYLKDLERSKPQLPESPNRTQLLKLIKDARRLLNLPDSGPWVVTRVQAMEKTLNAILRCLPYYNHSISNDALSIGCVSQSSAQPGSEVGVADQIICVQSGLLSILINFIGFIRNQRPSATQLIPDKSYQLAVDVLLAVCRSCPLAIHRILYLNDISTLIDCLVMRLSIPTPALRPLGTFTSREDTLDLDQYNISHHNPCTLRILDCLTCLLSQLITDCSCTPKTNGSYQVDYLHIQDLLGYLVSSGLVDLLANRLSSPRQAHWLLRLNSPCRNGSAHSMEQAQRVVLSTIALLTSIVSLYGRIPIVTSHNKTNPTSSDVSKSRNRTDFTGTVDRSINITCNSTNHDHSFSGDVDSSGRGQSISSHETPLCLSFNTNTSCPTDEYNITTEQSAPLSNDPTKLLDTILSTEVFGLVPLLYSLLLDPSARPAQAITTSACLPNCRKPIAPSHDADDGLQHTHPGKKSVKPTSNGSTKPTGEDDLPFLTPAIGQITLQSLKLINSFAAVNRSALQSMLSSELTCLLLRHILLTLLIRCTTRSGVSGCTTYNTDHEPPSSAQHSNDRISSSLNADSVKITSEADGISDLIPSGARQVIIRSVKTSSRPTEQDVSSTRLYTLDPSKWTKSASHVDQPPTPVTPRNVQGGNPAAPSPALCTPLTEAVLHEAILCIGHLCALNSDNQTSLQTGPPPSILQHLVALPFDYFSRRPLTDILYPTLIACCYEHATNLSVLEAELSTALLANYIEERLLERAMDALSDTDVAPLGGDKHIDDRFRFENRFPVCMWEAAKVYFTR